MNVYTPEEVDRINKIKETNDRLEEFFNGKRAEWSKNIDHLFEVLKIEITTQTSKRIMETQSLCLTYPCRCTDCIADSGSRSRSLS